MENLSSSELDSPSKTPFFIAIAAVIVAVVALAIGWMGLSRATELEKDLQFLESALSTDSGYEESIQANTERLESVSASMNTFSKSVNDALNGVSSDVSKIRSDIRKVAIDAGTAKKMVEALQEEGVKVAMVPSVSSPDTAVPVKKVPDATPGESGIYTIKSGDTLGRIAAAYNISLSQLQAANPGIDPRRLRIGQQVVVPATSD